MRTPTSTYRLQITADFDLHEAARQLPYLHDLGADWVYLSPVLAAEPGSSHGYDVVAHDHVDPARGGAEGLAAVSAEARRLGMGVLVDIVPNHVGVATPVENAWWWDLLQHGRGSAYATYFDVDWDFGGGRLRIPVVGDGDEGSIRVEDGELRYHEHRFPLAPGTSTHDEQHYELVSWRAADDQLNYRRFFAVNTLAAVRVEDPEVFDATHVEIRRWFDEGLVDGLRVDHPDGLLDPQGYLDDLAALTGGAYVLVEKILEPGEELPTSWPTAGTTGYDVLGLVDRVLTDPAAESRLPLADLDWAAMIHDTKRAVADGILHSEVRRIVRELPPVVEVRGAPATSPAVVEVRGAPATSPAVVEVRGAPATSHETPSRTPSPSCSRASRSTAPTSPRAASTSTRRSPWPAPTGPTSPTRSTRSRPCWATPRQRRPSASSRPRAWSWPRASRTARSTATTGSPPSTRWAATRASSRSPSRSSTSG